MPLPCLQVAPHGAGDRALRPPASGSGKLLRTRGGVPFGSSQGQAAPTRGGFQTMVPTEPKTPTLTWSPKEFIPQMEATVPLLRPPPSSTRQSLASTVRLLFSSLTPPVEYPGLSSPDPKVRQASHSQLHVFCARWLFCRPLGQELSPEIHFLVLQLLGWLSGDSNLQVPFFLVVSWPRG